MKNLFGSSAVAVVCAALALPHLAAAQTTPAIPPRQLDPDDARQGWNTILRLYSPLEPFFAKTWRPSEIELVR
jgi:hypothetical protein